MTFSMSTFFVSIPIRRSYRSADGEEKGRVSQGDYNIIKSKLNDKNIGWKYRRYLRVRVRDTDNLDYAIVRLSGWYQSRSSVIEFLIDYLSKNPSLSGESDGYWIDIHWSKDWTIKTHKGN